MRMLKHTVTKGSKHTITCFNLWSDWPLTYITPRILEEVHSSPKKFNFYRSLLILLLFINFLYLKKHAQPAFDRKDYQNKDYYYTVVCWYYISPYLYSQCHVYTIRTQYTIHIHFSDCTIQIRLYTYSWVCSVLVTQEQYVNPGESYDARTSDVYVFAVTSFLDTEHLLICVMVEFLHYYSSCSCTLLR